VKSSGEGVFLSPKSRARRVLAVGAALLVVQIILVASIRTATPHSGGDNAGYLSLAYSILQHGAYLDLHDPGLPVHTKYPPGYPAVLAVAMLAGARSWTAFKALSGLLVVVGVLLGYAWAAARRGAVFAGAVALVLGFSDAFLWSSRWILSDPLFVVLTLLALWVLERGESTNQENLHIVLGCAAAILAYFTRSAGLPLVVAVGLWLVMRRRRKAAVGFVAAFAAPALLWWVRSRFAGGGRYLAEFWLVDPYDPSRGSVGIVGLGLRAGMNLWHYVGLHIPAGITGYRGSPVAILGVLIVVLAAFGWWRRIRKAAGVAELFVPLYLALILLWPAVWSGDRFALPLFPFLLFYGGEALLALTGRWTPRASRVALVAAVLLLWIPATAIWWIQYQGARECRPLIQEWGPFACNSLRVQEFAAAALWVGGSLPGDAVILTRKPRIFFLLSGRRSVNYPLSRNAERFFDTASGAEARYVLVDYLDSLGPYYLVPVIEERAEEFCQITGWGDPAGVMTELLGILAVAEPLGEPPEPTGGEVFALTLPACPELYLTSKPTDPADYTSLEISLLSGLDP
jgi:hypothetical protein